MLVEVEVRVAEQREALARARQATAVIHAVELRRAGGLEARAPGCALMRRVVARDLVAVRLRAAERAGVALRAVLRRDASDRGAVRLAREDRPVRIEIEAAGREVRDAVDVLAGAIGKHRVHGGREGLLPAQCC